MRLADRMYGRNMRVAQAGGGTRFVEEALHEGVVEGHLRRQQFQRLVPVQAGVPGFVDLGHASLSNQSYYLIAADGRPWVDYRFHICFSDLNRLGDRSSAVS